MLLFPQNPGINSDSGNTWPWVNWWSTRCNFLWIKYFHTSQFFVSMFNRIHHWQAQVLFHAFCVCSCRFCSGWVNWELTLLMGGFNVPALFSGGYFSFLHERRGLESGGPKFQYFPLFIRNFQTIKKQLFFYSDLGDLEGWTPTLKLATSRTPH